MLAVVAYDIADPKRLQRVAKHCEDFGLRVQYSVFECRLEADIFERFGKGMQAIIDPATSWRLCCAEPGDRMRGVRWHWFEVEAQDGETMKLYFDRQPRSRQKGRRWWLFSVTSA